MTKLKKFLSLFPRKNSIIFHFYFLHTIKTYKWLMIFLRNIFSLSSFLLILIIIFIDLSIFIKYASVKNKSSQQKKKKNFIHCQVLITYNNNSHGHRRKKKNSLFLCTQEQKNYEEEKLLIKIFVGNYVSKWEEENEEKLFSGSWRRILWIG